MKRTFAAVAIAVVALAACGGSGSSKSGATPEDTKAFIDATLAGLMASTPASQRATLRSDMSCLATAIVEEIGVARLKDGGVTPAKLRSPEFQPPAEVARSMTPTARRAFAVRLQKCGIGRMVGSQASLEFAKNNNPGVPIDIAKVRCIGRGFEGAAAQPMIAGMMLNDLSASDSQRLSRLIGGCLNPEPLNHDD